MKTIINSDCTTELLILSYLIPIPIVIFDNYMNIIFIYLQGPIEVSDKTIKTFTDISTRYNTIFIKFNFSNSKIIPQDIYSIYY